MSNKSLVVKKNKFLAKMKKGQVQQAAKKSATNLDALRQAASQVGKKRLLFSLDATASRESAWEVATQITMGMFEAVPDKIEVAFGYHGGGLVQQVTDFSQSPKVFLDKLLSIQCDAGHTQLNGLLKEALNLEQLRAVVYIGDCFEESSTKAYELAKQLKLKGIKMFIFHDKTSGGMGYDMKQAARVFAGIVDITGGAVMDFNEQSIQQSKDFLRAIALYSVGGRKLLEQKKASEKGAVLLLEQLK